MKLRHLIFLVFVVSNHFAYAGESVPFVNFSERFELTRQGTFYGIPGERSKFQLSNRIIVKANISLNKSTLAGFIRDVGNVVELYEGKDFHYLMVELSGKNHLTAALASLAQHPEILLVQPDILQQRPGKTGNVKNTDDAETAFGAERTKIMKNKASREEENIPPHHRNKPVRIAIIDDGFDMTHPEFAHTRVAFQYDTETRSLKSRDLPGRCLFMVR